MASIQNTKPLLQKRTKKNMEDIVHPEDYEKY